MNRSVDDSVELLRCWILERTPEVGDLSADTDIIEQRIVTSLRFVGLVRYVEDLRGRPIAGDEMEVDSFRSLRRICERYLM